LTQLQFESGDDNHLRLLAAQLDLIADVLT
jgi:hypothetical protein